MAFHPEKIFGGGLVFSLTSRKGETWSVIGNMYDNPELLEVRKP